MKKLILLAVIASALFSSCQKNNSVAPDTKNAPGGLNAKSRPVLTTDVYVVGYHFEAQVGFVASYWKNGLNQSLQLASGNQSFARAIAIVGPDVYIAGEDNGIPCYWKNGVENPLASPNTTFPKGFAYGIAVKGSDVYVVGNYVTGTSLFSEGIRKAILWKNGVAVNLAFNGEDSQALGITIDGSDVYICGWNKINGVTCALYWKNNIFHLFAGTSTISEADAIAVDKNHNYYMSGSFGPSICYWKDSNLKLLDGGVTGGSPFGGLFVSHSIAVDSVQNVYVGGMNPNDQPCYWRDGHLVNLPTGGNTQTSANTLNGIALIGSDVYTIAYSATLNADVYFKNNTPTILQNDGLPLAIAVVQH